MTLTFMSSSQECIAIIHLYRYHLVYQRFYLELFLLRIFVTTNCTVRNGLTELSVKLGSQ
jgi:hypothetical protein